MSRLEATDAAEDKIKSKLKLSRQLQLQSYCKPNAAPTDDRSRLTRSHRRPATASRGSSSVLLLSSTASRLVEINLVSVALIISCVFPSPKKKTQNSSALVHHQLQPTRAHMPGTQQLYIFFKDSQHAAVYNIYVTYNIYGNRTYRCMHMAAEPTVPDPIPILFSSRLPAQVDTMENLSSS